MMKPDKFLRTTYKEVRNEAEKSGKPIQVHLTTQEQYSKAIINKENVEKLKKVIRSAKGKMEIPYLLYDKQGRPIGHEGRHRATAAKELDIERIPVTVGRKLKSSDYRDWKNIREHKGAKEDWKKELEHEEEITSSASADVPIQEQREYGKSKPEVLKDYEEIVEEETENNKTTDYDIDDSDDKTLDYKEEEETKEVEDD